MSIHLESKDLINPQQMEVAVNGPDGATHLILCTGVADLGSVSHETYTFPVGPQLLRRQFVGVIASGALSTVQVFEKTLTRCNVVAELGANLVSIEAHYDEEYGQVKVSLEIASGSETRKLAVRYNVSILAELPRY
jgi:hypothetical protein